MSKLFAPATLGTPDGTGLALRNRTFLAPMCQYSITKRDGVPHAWQMTHLGARAAGGFALVYTEATAVTAQGRISDQDTGIWNDEQAEAWAPIVDFIHSQGAAAGIQLAHAGGKASTYAWLPGHTAAGQRGNLRPRDGGWETIGPSATDVLGLAPATAMTQEQIDTSVADWAEAARRADAAGFDVVQIHAAHGYLVHQFLSPLTNMRTDAYGGSYENRTRYAREVIAAVREAWPAHKPLAIRLSGDDWVEGGWRIADTDTFRRRGLRAGGHRLRPVQRRDRRLPRAQRPGLPGPAGRCGQGRGARRLCHGGGTDHRTCPGRTGPGDGSRRRGVDRAGCVEEP